MDLCEYCGLKIILRTNNICIAQINATDAYTTDI